MASSVSKKSGKTYYLHQRDQESKSGGKVTLYYFGSGPTEDALDALPTGYKVSENPKIGLPLLAKFKGRDNSAAGHKIAKPIADAIERITSDIKGRIEAELTKAPQEEGPREFEFKVIVEGRQIQMDRVLPDQPPVIAEAATAPLFDPNQAGRKLVMQMQDAEGGSWTGRELRDQFGLASANLHKRRNEHRIAHWRDAKHQFHYPKWQFTPTGALLPGMQEVLRIFRSSDEWRVMRYFLAPRHQLDDRAPLDLLRAGEVDRVIAHATANGEENSW